MIITKQMIRDVVVFKGPLSLGELVYELKVDNDERCNVLMMLNDLANDNQITYDVDNGAWRPLITLS